jgi:hypothetical protein
MSRQGLTDMDRDISSGPKAPQSMESRHLGISVNAQNQDSVGASQWEVALLSRGRTAGLGRSGPSGPPALGLPQLQPQDSETADWLHDALEGTRVEVASRPRRRGVNSIAGPICGKRRPPPQALDRLIREALADTRSSSVLAGRSGSRWTNEESWRFRVRPNGCVQRQSPAATLRQ